MRHDFVVLCTLLATSAFAAEPAATLLDPAIPAAALYVMESDGTHWRRFFQMPQVREIGCPNISPDGKLIAFDAWMPDQQESIYSGRIFVVSTSQDEVQILGTGAMPSWGPDSARLVCAFANRGLGILTVATQEVEMIHDKGWGVTWSPDGKLIAYHSEATVMMYDIATKTKRTVFNGTGQFATVYQHGSFSPDGKRFLCVASTAEKNERVAVSFNIFGDDPGLKRHLEKRPSLWAKMAWHPKEPRVVFAMSSPEHRVTQLFEFNPDTSDEPRYLSGQDMKMDVQSPIWSPDGKRIYCVGKMRAAKPERGATRE